MARKAMSIQEMKLLTDIVSKRRPQLLAFLESIGSKPLSVEQREELRSVIAEELVETGLDENDEPNKRGLSLESLIDRLGHF